MRLNKVTTGLLALVLNLGLGGVAFGQSVAYVDDEAAPGGNGQEWSTAYKYLQDAFNAAGTGDEIRVAGGIYRPDEDEANPLGTGSRDATFQLMNGVEIYGGYAGLANPGSPNDRDVDVCETILSGDLAENDVSVPIGKAWQLIIEPTRAENSYHVITGSGTGESTSVDGFTIVGGSATELSSAIFGGGMYISNGSPKVANCTFTANAARYHGGGMYNHYGSAPTVVNCTFSGNATYYHGGGMTNDGSDAKVDNCIFSGNSVGAAWGGGGGMHNYESSPTVNNCTFIANTAVNGSGMYTTSNSESTVTNCIFWGNTQGQIGVGDSSSTAVSFSDIQGGWPGEGNIDADPLFVRSPDPGADGQRRLTTTAISTSSLARHASTPATTSPCRRTLRISTMTTTPPSERRGISGAACDSWMTALRWTPASVILRIT